MFPVTQSFDTLLKSGVQAALLATPDGLVIDAAAQGPTSIDFDSLAAEVAGVFRAADLIGRSVAGAAAKSMVITLENGQTVLAVPIAAEAIAVVMPQRGAASGVAPQTLDQISTAMRHFLEMHTGTQLLEAVDRAVQDLREEEPAPGRAARGEATRKRTGRIALVGVDLSVVGQVATVRITLGLGAREAGAKAVGRNVPNQQASLAAQATIRALLDLVPTGHAVELMQVQAATPARDALWVLTRFLSPDGEQSLFGISPVQEGDEATAAAKAVLNAVNRRIEILMEAPSS